jgi:glutamate carboxypeptidase
MSTDALRLPASIAALGGRGADLARRLEAWCAINSGSGHAAGLARMRATLRDAYAAAFPAATIEEPPADAPGHNPPGVRALRVRLRPEAPVQLLLNGHYDTVYEADDPFQAGRWLDEHQLNAPGAADMKGGLVAMLAALEAFESSPAAARLGWEVLLTPDEETGSHGSAALLEEAARRHRFGLVFEPARPNGDAVRSRKGTGELRVTCHGRAAHAAKIPNDGRNAILALGEFLLAAARVPAEMDGVVVNVGNIRGGGAATNVVPDFAEAVLDIRTTRMADRQPLLDRLAALAAPINARDGLRLELAGGFNRPPKECGPEEEAVFAAWRRAAHDLGLPPFDWVHAGGGSDGNLLRAAGLPNLDGIGPIGDHMHSDREVCEVTTLAPRAQVAALFLHRLATGEVVLPGRTA